MVPKHGQKLLSGSFQKKQLRALNAKRVMAGKKVAGTKIGSAMHGSTGAKLIAGGLVAGAAIGTMKSRTGKGADKVYGRPTGMYGY